MAGRFWFGGCDNFLSDPECCEVGQFFASSQNVEPDNLLRGFITIFVLSRFLVIFAALHAAALALDWSIGCATFCTPDFACCDF
jgi:hypothetical protein